MIECLPRRATAKTSSVDVKVQTLSTSDVSDESLCRWFDVGLDDTVAWGAASPFTGGETELTNIHCCLNNSHLSQVIDKDTQCQMSRIHWCNLYTFLWWLQASSVPDHSLPIKMIVTEMSMGRGFPLCADVPLSTYTLTHSLPMAMGHKLS